MALHPLVTFPWINREELKHVFLHLYSNDIAKQEHAVDRITAWEARALSRIPVALESSVAFVRANIAYEKAVKRGDADSDSLLREQYSMAIIRFVNLFSERNQMAPQALPVHLVASQLGVPRWIVDLRHDATHSTLPSLAELRAAAFWSLNWLKKEFWNIQCEETGRSMEQKTTYLNNLKDELVSYMQQTFVDTVEKDGAMRKKKKLLNRIEDLFLELGSEVCTVLMEDGYFLLTNEQLESIGLGNTDIFFTAKQTKESSGVPDQIWFFWLPIISLLAKRDLVSSMLLHIVSLIDEKSSVRNMYLCRWLYSLLAWVTNRAKKGNKEIDIPYKTLIKMCMKSDNKHLTPSVGILIDNSPLSEEQKEKLIHLKELFLNNFTAASSDSEPSTTALSDQIKSICKAEIWKPCSHTIDWSKVPFGELPGQTLGYRSLDLTLVDDIHALNGENDVVTDVITVDDSTSNVDPMEINFEAESWAMEDTNEESTQVTGVLVEKLWDTEAMVKKITML